MSYILFSKPALECCFGTYCLGTLAKTMSGEKGSLKKILLEDSDFFFCELFSHWVVCIFLMDL